MIPTPLGRVGLAKWQGKSEKPKLGCHYS